jgi:hypothetical protein
MTKALLSQKRDVLLAKLKLKHAILAKIDIGNSLAESAWQSRF